MARHVAGLVLVFFLVSTLPLKYLAIALVCVLLLTTSFRIAALHQYARAASQLEAAGGDGARRAGWEALLTMAASAEGSSFLFTGHSISLAHLRLSLMDREFRPSDYELLSALDEAEPGAPRHGLPEAALASLPSHIHPAPPPPAAPAPPAAAPAVPPASAPAPASRQPASGSAPLPGIARRGLAAAAAAPGAALRRDRSKDGSRTVCSVCLENYAEGDKVKTLPFCRHSFHADCLLPWLRQQGRGAFCPLCKTPVFSQSA